MNYIKGKEMSKYMKKHKKTKIVKTEPKRKRGRPRKIKVKQPKVEEPKSDVKTHKFMGFCKCNFMITKNDFESKFIFTCPSCSKRQRMKDLKKESSLEKYTSRRDYVEHTVNAEHHDSLPLNDNVPDELLKKFNEED